MSQLPKSAKDLFLAALDIEPVERAAFLDEACAGDAALKRQIEALLRVHDEPDSLLDRPRIDLGLAGGAAGSSPAGSSPAGPSPAGTSPNPTIDLPITEGPGTVIGPYKLLQQIGEGGMGVVYLAEQTDPVERRVALKIIKPGMDTRQVIARLEAERQALAMMDHPNIAKMLDAGATGSGRPYFVMVLVKGVPITEYCDAHQLTPRERLELFIPVCQAVQHAHQKGIIHRDIKPSNVMVADYDDRPVPKIIDFGVAKATLQRLTEKTVFTQIGQVVGTVEYMSPEQAKLNQLDIDTRSDIYSLGVLLYELLAGETPFDQQRLRSAAFDELLRIIREEEPPQPSLRLSTSASLPSIAANRHIEPRKLSDLLHGDLDWIVMKALEKDRTRRYETANGFANDIQRYLDDQPVTASPPSAAYRFKKFARRNKAALAAGSVLAATLFAGLAGTTWQAIRATRAEQVAQANLQDAVEAQQRADENFRRARQAVDEYFTLVSESKLLTEEGMLPLRKQLLEAALRYYRGFAEQHIDDLAVRAELAATYARIAMTELAMEETDWVKSYDASLDILERLLATDADSLKWNSYARGTFVYEEVADAQYGPPTDVIDCLERAVAIFSELARRHPQIYGFQHDLAACHLMKGRVHDAESELNPALSHFQDARGIWETLLRTDGARPEYASALADVYWELGFTNEGKKIVREGINILRAAFGDTQPEVADLLMQRSDVNKKEDEQDLREAISIYEKALSQDGITPRSMPETRWNYGFTRYKLGQLLRRTGRLEEATLELQKATDIHQLLAIQNPKNSGHQFSIATDCYELGNTHRDQGQNDEALKELLRSQDILQSLVEQYPAKAQYQRVLSDATYSLGQLYRETGRIEEAEKHFQDSVRHHQRLIAEFPHNQQYRPGLGYMLLGLAGLFEETKRIDEAEKTYEHALAVFQKATVDFPNWPHARLGVQTASTLLGKLFERTNRIAQAEQLYRDAMEVNKALSADFPENIDYHVWVMHRHGDLARCLRKQGKFADGDQLFRDALGGFEQQTTDFPEVRRYRTNLGHTLWELAELLEVTKRIPEAEETYRRALDVLQKAATDFPDWPDARLEVGQTFWLLGSLYQSTQRIAKAEQPFREALKADKNLSTDFPENKDYKIRVVQRYHNLIFYLLQQGKSAEAEQYGREAFQFSHTAEGNFLPVLEPELPRLEALLRALGMVQEAEQIERTFLKLHAEKFRKQYQKAMQLDSDQAKDNNSSAWFLATCPDPEFRNAKRAVELAKKATQLSPNSSFWDTLGTARYRAGQWQQTIHDLNRSDELSYGGYFHIHGFYQAMAHWQLGNHPRARQFYTAAVNATRANNRDLNQLRLRDEAAALLELEQDQIPPTPSSENPELDWCALILKADPTAAWAYYKRSVIHDRLGHAQQAQTDRLQASELYTTDIETHSNNPQAYHFQRRGLLYCNMGRWRDATADISRAFELSDSGTLPVIWCYFRALADLGAEDIKDYRVACADMLDRFGQSKDVNTIHWLVWTCALAPRALDDLDPATESARQAIAKQPENSRHLCTLGAVLYRAGQFEDAAGRLTQLTAEWDQTGKMPTQHSPAYTWYFLAMVHHQLGHFDQARMWLKRATEWHDNKLQPSEAGTASLPWNRRLTLKLLRHEAESLIAEPEEDPAEAEGQEEPPARDQTPEAPAESKTPEGTGPPHTKTE